MPSHPLTPSRAAGIEPGPGLDGELALDDERMAAFDAVESAFPPLGAEAEAKLRRASERAVERALRDAGLAPTSAPAVAAVAKPAKVDAGPSVLERIRRWLRSPALFVTVAAVAVAVIVTALVTKPRGDDPFALTGEAEARRVLLRCPVGAVAHVDATPREENGWCERDGAKDGWSYTSATGAATTLTCWKLGHQAPARDCLR